MFDDPRFVAEVRRAEEEREKRERERQSPAARERRARSRTEYRRLDRAAAIALAQRKFGAVATGPPPGGVQHLGARARGFIDDHTALVDNGDEQRPGLMSSLLPLRVERDGEKLPISLALQRSGDVFVSETALVPTRFGVRPGAALELTSSGLRIGLAAARESEGLLESDRVFFTDVASDTDAWLMPTVLGAEIFWQLRSPESPEALALDLGLPTGAEARLTHAPPPINGSADDTGERWVEIRRGERILAVIQPPAAFDSAGTELDAGYELSGSRLTVRVKHRDADVEYPILVDPPVEDLYGFGDTNFTGGWGYESNKGDHFWWDYYFAADGWRHGLYMGQHGGHFWYGEYGGWYLWAPGQTSYIYGADMEGVHHEEPEPPETTQNFYSGLSEPGRWQSLVDQAYDFRWHYRGHCANGASWQEEWNNNWPNGPWNCPSNPVGHNKLSFGAWIRDTGWRTTQGHLMVRDSRVYMSDPEAPTSVSVTNQPPSDWRKDATYTSSVSASDPGLGIRNVFVERADGGGIIARHHAGNGSCGGRFSRCPASGTWSVSYSTTSLPEGVTELRGRAIDAIEQASVTAAFPVRVDRSNPSRVALSGDLRERGVATDGITKLHVEADDAYSGVRKLEMFVDGESATWMPGVQAATQDCASQGCSMIRDLDFDPTGLDEGPHRVKVIATDGVSRTGTSEEFIVIVDRTDPSRVDLSGELRQRADRGVATGRITKLHVEADDAYSGVRKLEMFVDDQSAAWMPGVQAATQDCASQGCSMIQDLDFEPTGLDEGPHRVKVIATDGVSRTRTSEEFTVIVDRTPPTTDRVDGDFRALAVSGGQHDLAIAASDNGPVALTAGVESIEVHVRDPHGVERRRHRAEQSGAGAPLTTTYTADTRAETYDATPADGYTEGRHRVRVRVADGSGNLAPDTTYDVIVDRGAPNLTLSGQLADVGSGELSPGTYALTIDATDGDAATNASARSGVGRIDVYVDDELVYTDEQPCPQSSCPMTREFVFDTSHYDGGQHEVEVVATDLAENERSQTLTVTTGCCLAAASPWTAVAPTQRVYYADANGDAAIDVITYDIVTGGIDVRLSNGEGFDPPTRWGSLGALGAHSPAFGDVDGDGDADMATLFAIGVSTPSLHVALSDGSGAFGQLREWGAWPLDTELRLADLDGDEMVDAVGRHHTAGTVTGAYSTGSAFNATRTWGTSTITDELHFGDVDGDGAADMVARDDADQVRVSLSDAAVFGPAQTWVSVPANADVALGDVDGDVLADLVVRDRDTDVAEVRRASETGFGAATELGDWSDAYALAAHEVTGDGRADLIGALGGPTPSAIYVGETAVAPPIEPEIEEPDDDPNLDDRDFMAEQDADLAPGESNAGGSTFSTRAVADPPLNSRLALAAQADEQLIFRDRLPGVDGNNEAAFTDATMNQTAVDRINELLDRMKEVGINTIRVNLWWGMVQKRDPDANGEPVFDFSRYDAGIHLIRAKRMRVHLTLSGVANPSSGFECNGGFTPPDMLGCHYTVSGGTVTPHHQGTGVVSVHEPNGVAEKAAAYAKFVRAAVKHFSLDAPAGRRVNTFALWNEPNFTGGTQFLAAADPSNPFVRDPCTRDMTSVYRELYDAGKAAADAANPNAYVLMGELSSRRAVFYRANENCAADKEGILPTTWLERFVNAKPGVVRTDGVAYHPYQHPSPPWRKGPRMYQGIGRLKGVVDKIRALTDDARTSWIRTEGNRTPGLYLTEFGYLNMISRRTSTSLRRFWHTEKERSYWMYGGRKPNRMGALARAKRFKARYLVWYSMVEAPPPNATTGHEDYGMLGDGMSGPFSSPWRQAGGTRQYGKWYRGSPNSGRLRVNHPQDRSAFCQLWAWSKSQRGPRDPNSVCATLGAVRRYKPAGA